MLGATAPTFAHDGPEAEPAATPATAGDDATGAHTGPNGHEAEPGGIDQGPSDRRLGVELVRVRTLSNGRLASTCSLVIGAMLGS